MPKARRRPVSSQAKPSPAQTEAKAHPTSLIDIAIRTALILTILTVYAQVAHFDFTDYDDPDYVTANPHVQAGLTLASIKWAATAVVSSNWMPLTLLSHMLDCQLFGMASGIHHLVNVLFHISAALMLFAALKRATGARWPSAFVAFAFALHPLRVESVAWVAERKDVLSAFLFFTALYAYVRYVESPSWRRYLLVAVAFCLGLMAKPMLVTFPFALLLFDVWPLRRVQLPRILLEKLPLMALSAADSVVTYLVQGKAGAIAVVPFGQRLANSLIAYVTYIGKMFWPTRLACFYMFPDSIPAWQTAGAAAILLAISAFAIYLWRTRPYFATGWLWYLGMLVPAIGLVQVGGQSHADRYTYLPTVGLLWILAWGAADVLKTWPAAKSAVIAVAVLCCTACTALSWTQAGYWQNSTTLYQHAVDVTDNNGWARYKLAEAHYLLGSELMNSGHGSAAIGHFEEALGVRPNYPEAYNNLGILYAKMPGRTADAIANFEAALRLDPNLAPAHRNLGILLASVPGRENEAIAHLEAAQRLQPDPETLRMIQRLREGDTRR